MTKYKKKIVRENQILEAAFLVFVEKGYTKSTMDDIVQRSKMSKGAIYHYYKSKKDLFLSLIDHWETYSFPNFYSKDLKNRTATKTLFDLCEIVLGVFNSKKHVFLAEVEFWALANKDNDVKDKSKILYQKLLNLFELILKKGIREKEFRAINTKVVSMTILSSLQGINWFCLYDEGSITAEDYLKTSMKLLVRSIKIEK